MVPEIKWEWRWRIFCWGRAGGPWRRTTTPPHSWLLWGRAIWQLWRPVLWQRLPLSTLESKIENKTIVCSRIATGKLMIFLNLKKYIFFRKSQYVKKKNDCHYACKLCHKIPANAEWLILLRGIEEKPV